MLENSSKSLHLFVHKKRVGPLLVMDFSYCQFYYVRVDIFIRYSVIFVNLRVQKKNEKAFMCPSAARCHCDTRSFLLATPDIIFTKIIWEENSSEIFGC